MGFTITDGDGNISQQVWSCTDCTYCSTKKHFRDGQTCPLCDSDAEQISTITQSTGMPDYKYTEILNYLQENCGGIGPKTVEHIREAFPEGDEFVEACKDAYENGNYAPLTEIDGIGKSYARGKLALGLAEKKGWEDGVAEPIEVDTFKFKQ